jgi:hypothetical protein
MTQKYEAYCEFILLLSKLIRSEQLGYKGFRIPAFRCNYLNKVNYFTQVDFHCNQD